MHRPLWEINAFYAPRMHVYRQEVTSYFWTRIPIAVLVKNFIFRGMFIHAYTILFVLKSFFQVAIFTTLGLLLIRYPFITPCYLGKYVFSLSEQPSCKYFRISVVFVYGVNYKLLQLKKYMNLLTWNIDKYRSMHFYIFDLKFSKINDIMFMA